MIQVPGQFTYHDVLGVFVPPSFAAAASLPLFSRAYLEQVAADISSTPAVLQVLLALLSLSVVYVVGIVWQTCTEGVRHRVFQGRNRERHACVKIMNQGEWSSSTKGVLSQKLPGSTDYELLLLAFNFVIQNGKHERAERFLALSMFLFSMSMVFLILVPFYFFADRFLASFVFVCLAVISLWRSHRFLQYFVKDVLFGFSVLIDPPAKSGSK